MVPVSLLSTYLYCPRKVFLQKALEVAEPDKDALVKGAIRHQVYDLVNKAEEAIVTGFEREMPLAAIEDAYHKAYMQFIRQVIQQNTERLRLVKLDSDRVQASLMKSLLPEVRHRTENIHRHMTERRVFGTELWEALTPKIKSEYALSSDALQLTGVVDSIEVYPDTILPREHKTGKAPKGGVWPGHQIQIAAYILLLEEKFSTTIPKGTVVYVDENTAREVVMNPFLSERVREVRDTVVALLCQKDLPPIIANENKCQACGLRRECRERAAAAQS